MKLTLTCDCGNTETIEVNPVRMSGYVDHDDTIYMDDFQLKNQKFMHDQSHPDESTISCTNCPKSINFSI